MAAHELSATQWIACYCGLCISRCGAVTVVEDGRFVALEPDPTHPTGKALCAKGRAAPELVYHQDRLLYSPKRIRPKGDPDSGWQRIRWHEALDAAVFSTSTCRESTPPHCSLLSEETSAPHLRSPLPTTFPSGRVWGHLTVACRLRMGHDLFTDSDRDGEAM